MKDIFFAITLTLLFSIGVGVLFVRTVMEMLQILFCRQSESESQQKPRTAEQESARI